MRSVVLKNSDETIGEYLSRINRSTSTDLSGSDDPESSRSPAGLMIIVSALSAFLNAYFGARLYKQGLGGFISAWLASLHTLLGEAKKWEYSHRGAVGGTSFTPPREPAQIEKLVRKYGE